MGRRPRGGLPFSLAPVLVGQRHGRGCFAIEEITDEAEIVEPAAGQGLKRAAVILGDIGVWHGDDLRGGGVEEPDLRFPGFA